MKYLFILSVLFALHVKAAVYNVSSASDIDALAPVAGDTLMALNGTWTNQNVLLEGTGTASNPIVFMAQTPGGVIFNGTSSIVFGHASYIIVKGIYFNGGTVTQKLIYFGGGSSYCRLTNCKFNNVNNPILNNTFPYFMASIGGMNCRLDHCSFMDSFFYRGPIVATEPIDYIHAEIDSNYFGHRPPEPTGYGGGSECIRLGSAGGTAMRNANNYVHDNWIEGYSAEQEIISSKTSRNKITSNVLKNCQGLINLRQGNSDTVAYNFLLGTVDTAKTGIGIYGQDHYVVSNYISGMKGNNRTPAFAMANGSTILNCEATNNPQIARLHIDSNLVVNDTPAMVHGYYLNALLQVLPPLSIGYHANIMVSTIPYALPQTVTAPFLLKGSNNIYYGYISGFTTGWTNTNPGLVADGDGIYRLPTGSALIGSMVGSNAKTMYSPTSPLHPIAKTSTGCSF